MPQARALRPEFTEIIKFLDILRAEMIMTADPKSINEGQSVQEALKVMTENKFDQLIIANDYGPVGIIRETQLKSKPKNMALVVAGYEKFGENNSLRKDAKLGSVLGMLSTTPSCVVVESGDEKNVVGLIHFSDLNRHPMRIYFYLLISAIEMGLTSLIYSRDPDEAWSQKIKESTLKQIDRYFPGKQKKEIGLQRLEVAGFKELIEILRVFADWWQGLINSDNDEATLISIQDPNTNENTRNKIMHTNKKLVKNHADVVILARQSNLLIKILDNVEHLT